MNLCLCYIHFARIKRVLGMTGMIKTSLTSSKISTVQPLRAIIYDSIYNEN